MLPLQEDTQAAETIHSAEINYNKVTWTDIKTIWPI